MTDPNAAPSAAPEKAGIIEDFVDIFASPASVFTRRATSSPLVPWLVVSALLIVMIIVNKNVMANINDAMMSKGFEAAMKANPSLTADQMEKSKGMMQTVTMVSQVIGAPIALLVIGLFVWIVGKIFGATLSYGTGLLIASFGWVPRVVEQVVLSIQGLVLDTSTFTSPFQLSLGAARFIDPASMNPAVVGLLARVDVITIWGTVLVAIGLVYAGKMPKSKMWIAAGVIWLLGSIPAIYGAFKMAG